MWDYLQVPNIVVEESEELTDNRLFYHLLEMDTNPIQHTKYKPTQTVHVRQVCFRVVKHSQCYCTGNKQVLWREDVAKRVLKVTHLT